MKRFIVTLWILALPVLFLTACGDSSEAPPTGEDAAQTQETTETAPEEAGSETTYEAAYPEDVSSEELSEEDHHMHDEMMHDDDDHGHEHGEDEEPHEHDEGDDHGHEH